MDVQNMLSDNPRKTPMYYLTQWWNIIGDKFPILLVIISKLLAFCLTTKLFYPLNEKIWAKNQKVKYEEIEEYKDLLTYFTRDPPNFNPKWDDDKYDENKCVLSPVEGTVVSSGIINNDKTANVLNGKFNIDTMLKEEGEYLDEEDKYNDDHLCQYPFIVIFLSPTDVHNVYFPFKCGQLIDLKYIHGKYLLTNPYAIQYSSKVYQKNFRVSFKFRLNNKNNDILYITMISANLVGVIETKLNIGSNVKFGDKIGNFLLGSTVVMILNNKKIKWNKQKGDIVDIMTKLN